jgi:hypothetical protein
MEGLLLFHIPPDTASLKLVADEAHRVVTPAIAAGFGFTVSGMVA